MKPRFYFSNGKWVACLVRARGQTFGYGKTMHEAHCELVWHLGALVLADEWFKDRYPEASARYEACRQT